MKLVTLSIAILSFNDWTFPFVNWNVLYLPINWYLENRQWNNGNKINGLHKKWFKVSILHSCNVVSLKLINIFSFPSLNVPKHKSLHITFKWAHKHEISNKKQTQDNYHFLTLMLMERCKCNAMLSKFKRVCLKEKRQHAS